MNQIKKFLFLILVFGQVFLIPCIQAFAQSDNSNTAKPGRERLLMDFGWRFALGHAFDTEKDFKHGTGYFSYFAKTGYGDGPASRRF